MTLLADLTTESLHRDAENGWTRDKVSEIPELRNPELLAPFKQAYLSQSSLTVKDTRSRKVVGSLVSNGELSRLYLKKLMSQAAENTGKSFLAKRVPFRRDAMQFLDRRPAYFFDGQVAGPFVLVDISACYASLYTRLTLDLTYRPECNPPLLGLGRAAFPRASEWVQVKAPRNALWGNLLRPRGREWRHGVLKENAYPNAFFAPDLSGIVYDAAHAIALEAREKFGALSWAVDGGAFRPEEGRKFIAWLDENYGLTAEVRAEGPGWMFGPTSYSIGPVTTTDVKKGRAHEWPEMNVLRNQGSRQRSWLADVFKERE
jgi:hypothetical protein